MEVVIPTIACNLGCQPVRRHRCLRGLVMFLVQLLGALLGDVVDASYAALYTSDVTVYAAPLSDALA